MKTKQLKNVSFDLIRYANCWEDADVLLAGLQAAPGAKLLSIASAGDNSFSLLTADPELVVAVDVNPVQLHLTELKKAAFIELALEEFLELFGFRTSLRRKELFSRVKKLLRPAALSYWESNLHIIEGSVIAAGKLEKYFGFFRKKILPFIHTEKRCIELFRQKTASEQEEFYSKHWNNWRWRLFFRIFFSKYVLGKYGRDPEFLEQVNVPVSQFIFEKAERHLNTVEAQKNYFLHFIHRGTFGDHLPHYARKENFEKVKSNIHKLVLKEGFAEDAIKEHGTFNYMNLSNIFEYMDMSTFRNVSENLLANLTEGGRMAYWNLMVPRRLSAVFPEQLEYKKDLSEQLGKTDKGFFYNSFIIDEKK
jgi:S-adenosylmethionine-diacylglycerol 3-amino-3-carboxypropyl transferase